MKQNITAIIFAYNEEKNIPSLMENLKEMDEVIIVDHESTDGTAKVAKKLGATVITRPVIMQTPTERDVKWFKERYGYEPEFKAGVPEWSWEEECNTCKEFGRNDWQLHLDCDERVMWDFDEIQSALPFFQAIRCPLDNGRIVIPTIKLFRRSKMWFIGMTHTAPMGYGVLLYEPTKMQIKHIQEVKEYRKKYLGLIEFAYFLHQDTKMCYYLAREYTNNEQYEKAIKFFIIYHKTAYKKDEIALAYMHMAWCYWRLGNEEESLRVGFQAMRYNPRSKMIFDTLTTIVNPSDREMYLKFKELAPNQ
jgi:glycosyltransferase involved in cell wall biosynthesis